ncbi:MAG: hypothetical protein LBH77_06200 [Tannerella sp.]|jgi:hypothetical protein|nr:hypothetical protein [Tannerella sp.]
MCEKLDYIFQSFYSGLLRQRLAMTGCKGVACGERSEAVIAVKQPEK